MVSDGFDLEKDQQMRIIVTDPILRELCVLFRIQITLLLVNFSEMKLLLIKSDDVQVVGEQSRHRLRCSISQSSPVGRVLGA